MACRMELTKSEPGSNVTLPIRRPQSCLKRRVFCLRPDTTNLLDIIRNKRDNLVKKYQLNQNQREILKRHKSDGLSIKSPKLHSPRPKSHTSKVTNSVSSNAERSYSTLEKTRASSFKKCRPSSTNQSNISSPVKGVSGTSMDKSSAMTANNRSSPPMYRPSRTPSPDKRSEMSLDKHSAMSFDKHSGTSLDERSLKSRNNYKSTSSERRSQTSLEEAICLFLNKHYDSYNGKGEKTGEKHGPSSVNSILEEQESDGAIEQSCRKISSLADFSQRRVTSNDTQPRTNESTSRKRKCVSVSSTEKLINGSDSSVPPPSSAKFRNTRKYIPLWRRPTETTKPKVLRSPLFCKRAMRCDLEHSIHSLDDCFALGASSELSYDSTDSSRLDERSHNSRTTSKGFLDEISTAEILKHKSVCPRHNGEISLGKHCDSMKQTYLRPEELYFTLKFPSKPNIALFKSIGSTDNRAKALEPATAMIESLKPDDGISKYDKKTFDPSAILDVSYLRLTRNNVETLEAMCRDRGIIPDLHANSHPSDYDPDLVDVFADLRSEKRCSRPTRPASC